MRATASQSTVPPPLDGSSWPVTTVNDVDENRWVTGIPAYAGTARAEVMPGTTSYATPAAARACRLLAAAGEHERVAALEPHHRLAGQARARPEGR